VVSHAGYAFSKYNDYKEFDSLLDNFRELLILLGGEDEEGRGSVCSNALKNRKLITPGIQKEIIDVCVNETLRKIIEDVVKCGIFVIIVEETQDISVEEKQMVIFLLYVDTKGDLIEWFAGVVNDGFGSSIITNEGN